MQPADGMKQRAMAYICATEEDGMWPLKDEYVAKLMAAFAASEVKRALESLLMFIQSREGECEVETIELVKDMIRSLMEKAQ